MNIMLDLETADSGSNSAILSIGAVHFDTEHVSSYEFYAVVKPKSSIQFGTMGMDTVQWWMKQQEEARQVWNDENAVDLSVALLRFTDWVLGFKAKEKGLMWGNGSDFDNVILANAYRALSLKQPWSFWNNRCYRTLKGFFHNDTIKALTAKYDTAEDGVRHNALYDARLQANIAKDLMISLERR